jgi:hypothetical protein
MQYYNGYPGIDRPNVPYGTIPPMYPMQNIQNPQNPYMMQQGMAGIAPGDPYTYPQNLP